MGKIVVILPKTPDVNEHVEAVQSLLAEAAIDSTVTECAERMLVCLDESHIDALPEISEYQVLAMPDEAFENFVKS